MPRQAGIEAPGALQHIIIRGIERKVIFKNDTDDTAYVLALFRLERKFDFLRSYSKGDFILYE